VAIGRTDYQVSRPILLVGLVAQRLTNAEIAQELFVSCRTVKAQVSNAFAKLGVRNRRQRSGRSRGCSGTGAIPASPGGICGSG